MTGILLYSFAAGNRCEPFAEYILSSVATVIRVPREIDVGFDLLCTLMHLKDHILYAGKSFGVQVKSSSQKEAITYGGFNKDDPTKGKKYEIEWLKNQDQPLFICLVNLKEFTLALFSTDRIWQLFGESPNPGEIKLDFYNEPKLYGTSGEYFPKEDLETSPDGTKLGDGCSYKIQLGKPFCEISLKEISEDQEYRDDLRKKINNELDLSYENLFYRNLKLPYSKQRVYVDDPKPYPPNYLAKEGWNYYQVNQKPTNEGVDLVLFSISPLIRYLMEASWDNQREEYIINNFSKFVLDHLRSKVNRGEYSQEKEYFEMKLLERSIRDKLNKSRAKKRDKHLSQGCGSF